MENGICFLQIGQCWDKNDSIVRKSIRDLGKFCNYSHKGKNYIT